MENKIQNTLGSERTVEVAFVCEMIQKYLQGAKLLDVGGIPTDHSTSIPVFKAISDYCKKHDISDFRGGKYQGDFITLQINEIYDAILFLSSLEHFPQCTEGDLIFREGEDRKGYVKALSLLNSGGKIILTVPFGKCRWQPYHQNYDMDAILRLTEGSKIVESFVYKLNGDTWEITDPNEMSEVLYTDKAYGVGCFLLEKI